LSTPSSGLLLDLQLSAPSSGPLLEPPLSAPSSGLLLSGLLLELLLSAPGLCKYTVRLTQMPQQVLYLHSQCLGHTKLHKHAHCTQPPGNDRCKHMGHQVH
jgi:hypothetical protein